MSDLDTLSTQMNRTVEVDPEQLKFEHRIDSYEKTRRSTKDESDEQKAIDTIVESLTNQLDRYTAAVNGNVPKVKIGYILPEQLTELELLEERAQTMPDDMARRRALTEIDRLAVKWGVVGHSNCSFEDVEIKFERLQYDWQGIEVEGTADHCVAYYERRRWLRPLRWAIYRMNTLTEKKSGNL